MTSRRTRRWPPGAPGRLMRVAGARGVGKTVDFAIPYLRQYLREHAAYIRMYGIR